MAQHPPQFQPASLSHQQGEQLRHLADRYRRITRLRLESVHFEHFVAKAEQEHARAQVHWCLLGLEAVGVGTMLFTLVETRLHTAHSFVWQHWLYWGAVVASLAASAILVRCLLLHASVTPTSSGNLLARTDSRIDDIKKRWNIDNETDWAKLLEGRSDESSKQVIDARLGWKELRDEEFAALVAMWGIVSDDIHSINLTRRRLLMIAAVPVVIALVLTLLLRAYPVTSAAATLGAQ